MKCVAGLLHITNCYYTIRFLNFRICCRKLNRSIAASSAGFIERNRYTPQAVPATAAVHLLQVGDHFQAGGATKHVLVHLHCIAGFRATSLAQQEAGGQVAAMREDSGLSARTDEST